MSSALVSNPSAHPNRSKGLPPAFQVQSAEIKNRQLSSAAEHFYDLMLESCERLFENDIEQQVFEDQMRYMFGIKVLTPYMSEIDGLILSQEAYKIFTIDKLIGALIKQVSISAFSPFGC